VGAGVAANTDFNVPARPLNSTLTRLFAGEAKRLVNIVRGRKQTGYRRGVSLIALLERGDGLIEPRPKPANLPADPWQPGAESPRLSVVG
jgi:hypothetical protein